MAICRKSPPEDVPPAPDLPSGDYPDAVGVGIEDDHTPFLRQGVPSIDLIDWDFPSFHKTCDNLSAVSEKSLDASGEAVAGLLSTL